MKPLLSISLIIFLSLSIFSQNKPDSLKTSNEKQLFQAGNGTDTLLFDTLKEVPIYARKFESFEEERRFKMLKYRIITVYPYLVNIRSLYKEVKSMEANSSRRDYKRYKKEREDQLRGQFEDDLKNLSVGEGKVLVKLINRETGNSFYELLKEVKGGFNAWIYNLAAKKYDYDLKAIYRPEENKDMEEIIKNLQEFGSEYEFMNF